MKALPKRKGNTISLVELDTDSFASMKALPKRKGKFWLLKMYRAFAPGLNESPSEKEGKSVTPTDNEKY